MRPTDSSSGLGFLLSLGALPLLACAEGSGDDDGAATTSPGTQSASSSAGDTSTGGDGGTGTADDEDTGTSSPTTAADDSTGELPEACMGIAITPGCQAQADKFAECFPEYAQYYQDYAIYCACNVTYYLEMYGGPGCGQAQDEMYACIGTLTCEQLNGEDPYCVEESMAIDEICDFGSTSSGGIDDSADGG